MESENKFDDIVSVFENFSAEPKDVPLSKWLAACAKGGKFKEQVLEYRTTGADELKKSLPLITPGAQCEGGRRREHVKKVTGWICLDIDDKDNPGITDAGHLRDQIIKISNIAFAALSTGGKGVWALVKVSDPDNLDAHFQALIRDFQHFGIKLDSTKGRNPNDARFFSYDPDARIKRNFEVYTKKFVDRPRNSVLPVQKTGRSSYGETALQQEIGQLALAQKGSRNETLFKSAASLFELVAGGELTMGETESALMETAQRIGLNKSESMKTIQSAKQTGMQNPRSGKKNSLSHRPPARPYTPPQKEKSDRQKNNEADYAAAFQADPMLREIVSVFDAIPDEAPF